MAAAALDATGVPSGATLTGMITDGGAIYGQTKLNLKCPSDRSKMWDQKAKEGCEATDEGHTAMARRDNLVAVRVVA